MQKELLLLNICPWRAGPSWQMWLGWMSADSMCGGRVGVQLASLWGIAQMLTFSALLLRPIAAQGMSQVLQILTRLQCA